MPSMPEPIILALGVALAGVAILAPLWRDPRGAGVADDHDAFGQRHRIALEAVRDIEADRRSGSLDEAAHLVQRRDAERHAARTLVELEAARAAAPRPGPLTRDRPARRRTVVAAGAIAAALLAGVVIPTGGLANPTVVDEQLAAEQAAESARQKRVAALLEEVGEDPGDTAALSALADAYLAGGSAEDLSRAAAALQLLISLEPDNADAFARIITAYLRAGDHDNAGAALDAFARVDGAEPADLAFFAGLIALRGDDDPAAAVEAFDDFLELAPADPRAPMVESLRDEADAAR